MKLIAAVLLLLAAPLAAQTIAPSQIKPGAENQVLKTTGGKAAWGNNSASVSSVFGRTGDVLPASGDYNCSQITSAICSLPSLFNQTVEVDGAAKTQRAKLNFINGSAGTVSCVDNPVTLATDCTFTGGASSGITYSIADVTGSRAANTVYQNTSGSVMFIGGSVGTSGSGVGNIVVAQGPTAFSLPFVDWANQSTATVSSGDAGFSATIMPGYYYTVQTSGAVNAGVRHWTQITSTGGGGGGGGFTAAGDLSGSSSSQTVVGLDGVPFCSGYTPTNGQFIELTTGGSPNPCYTAATPSGSGNTTSTSLSTNRLPKANGANSIVNSSMSDDGATVSTTEPLTAPAVNTVINAGSSLSAAVTACGSAQTIIQITQTIAVGTGITVPANCTLLFQSAGNLTGTSITINGAVQASRHQVFGTSLAVTLGPLTTTVPIEWFGGKADATGSVGVGSDNLAAFNAANTALSAGCITFVAGGYRFSGTPTFTKTNMCIAGITIGSPAPAIGIPSNSSNLFIDSASASGPRFTSTAFYGEIRNVAVIRTQTPTGTAKGISVEAYGVKVHDLASEDSIYNLYYVNAASAGQGITENTSVGWGYTGLAGTPGVPVCGYYVDSAGGAVNASIRFLYASAGSNLAGAQTTTGLCAVGTNISDMSINHFESAQTNYGIDLENSGTSNFVAQDIQINDSILNGCLTACLKANGLQSTTDIAPHLSVNGGNFFPTGSSAVGALIQNSSNVSLSGIQIFAGGSGVLNISLSSVDGFTVTHNTIDDLDFSAGVGISCLNSTHGTISNNQIKKTTSGTGIKNVGCTLVSEQGNTIAGNNSGSLGSGITFDAASSNNGPWSLNTIDTGTVTTPVTDAGTNNNPALVAGANITITGKWPNQTIAAAASGTGISGATSGQALIAGSATTATSSKALAGAGAGIVTGPASATATDIPVYTSTTGGQVDSGVAIGSLAPLASPALTGVPTAPTATANTSTGQVATTAYVVGQAGTGTPLVNGTAAVGTSLLYARQDHIHPTDTTRAPLASPTFTGTVTAPVIVATTNSVSPSFSAPASGTATGGANFSSGAYGANGSYWTGSVSNTDSWTWSNVLGTGANPTSTWTLAHTGSPGSATVSLNGTTVPASSTLALHIANGTSALGTGAISSGTCATVVTTTATGTATTDVVGWGFNGDPTAVTGYAPATTGMLTILAYPSANNVNFKVCNNTSASITPGAITLNWTVIR